MAGGIGRTFGVDPVLIRVAFVILTIFGGFGVLLYVLGWLLLPADGDEVSAAEALIGRGRSSTSPVLTIGLAIIAAISLTSMFSWGLPFWPLVIIGVVAIMMARKKGQHGGHGGCAGNAGPRTQAVNDWSTNFGDRVEQWGNQAEQWVARQPWSSNTPNGTAGEKSDPASPFEKPAFWDEDSAGQHRGSATGTGRVNMAKADTTRDTPAEPTPPAWDPLGVAPFAWDLPEPAPAPAPPAHNRGHGVVGRITMGLVLLVGGLATAGIFAGWWQLSWAGVAATALAVLAIGLFVGSLRGRGLSLIPMGVFLSFVTLALTVTGIDGTSGYGQQTWAPTTVNSVQQEYVLNGGQGTLDLRGLSVPAGRTVSTEVEVRAGQASVIIPAEANVEVTCTTNAGEVDCLGNVENGLHKETSATQDGSSDEGTIDLTVHVGAGQAEVRNG